MNSTSSSLEELLSVFAPGSLAYEASRGDALYRNGLGTFPPTAGTVIALVRRACDHCHAFMVQSNYATHTPDGRPMLYLDLDLPGQEGQENPALNSTLAHATDTRAIAYYKQLGFSGDAPFKPILWHDEVVPKANVFYRDGQSSVGDWVAKMGARFHGLPTDNPYRFPVLIVYHAAGEIEVVSAGVVDGIAWFNSLPSR